MTPLTAAAEHCHLRIVRFLLEQPGIDITLCGDYNWPAFLHLLRNSQSVSTLEGISLLNALCVDPLVNQTILSKSRVSGPFAIVLENALRSANESIIQKVIDIVQGAAGGKIIPLLIRSHRPNDKQGLKWLLYEANIARDLESSWALICDYLIKNEDPEGFELFVHVAETHVQWGSWLRAITMCLCSQNFRFAQQFFFEVTDKRLSELTQDSLRGYDAAAENDSLIEMWDDSGYSNVVLRNAVAAGIWKDSPQFEKILCDPRINPNGWFIPTPFVEINHRFIN